MASKHHGFFPLCPSHPDGTNSISAAAARARSHGLTAAPDSAHNYLSWCDSHGALVGCACTNCDVDQKHSSWNPCAVREADVNTFESLLSS